jgi:hypothetical protein
VRSTKLDTWIQENIDIMENLGNQIANEYFEYSLSQSKPNEQSSLETVKSFVYDKYVRKMWSRKGVADPKTRYMQSLISGVPFQEANMAMNAGDSKQ